MQETFPISRLNYYIVEKPHKKRLMCLVIYSILITDITWNSLCDVDLISYHSYEMAHCMLPDKHCLSHSMCHYQVMLTLHFLNDVVNDAESMTLNRRKNRSLRHICKFEE